MVNELERLTVKIVRKPRRLVAGFREDLVLPNKADIGQGQTLNVVCHRDVDIISWKPRRLVAGFQKRIISFA